MIFSERGWPAGDSSRPLTIVDVELVWKDSYDTRAADDNLNKYKIATKPWIHIRISTLSMAITFILNDARMMMIPLNLELRKDNVNFLFSSNQHCANRLKYHRSNRCQIGRHGARDLSTSGHSIFLTQSLDIFTREIRDG